MSGNEGTRPRLHEVNEGDNNPGPSSGRGHFIPERHATGSSSMIPKRLQRLLEKNHVETPIEQQEKRTYLRNHIISQLSQRTLDSTGLLALRKSIDYNIHRQDIVEALTNIINETLDSIKRAPTDRRGTEQGHQSFLESVDYALGEIAQLKSNALGSVSDGKKQNSTKERNDSLRELVDYAQSFHDLERTNPSVPPAYS